MDCREIETTREKNKLESVHGGKLYFLFLLMAFRRLMTASF